MRREAGDDEKFARRRRRIESEYRIPSRYKNRGYFLANVNVPCTRECIVDDVDLKYIYFNNHRPLTLTLRLQLLRV